MPLWSALTTTAVVVCGCMQQIGSKNERTNQLMYIAISMEKKLKNSENKAQFHN